MKKLLLLAAFALGCISASAQKTLTLSTYKGTDLAKYDGQTLNVSVSRYLFTGWNTISLPFAMSEDQVNEVFGKQFKGKILDACTVVGNCLMISRKNIEKVGVFDTIFGKGYTEETDYQFKSMQKGFKAKVLLDTYVYHQSRVSFGESPEQLQIRAEHLELFFKRWYDEYMKLMAKYKKHDPIVYIKEKVDYSSVKEDYTIAVKKLEDLEVVSNMVNKLMLEGINVRVKVRKKVLKQMNGIMLFNPTIKKGL